MGMDKAKTNSNLLAVLIAYQIILFALYMFAAQTHLAGQVLIVINIFFVLYITMRSLDTKNKVSYWLFLSCFGGLLLAQFIRELNTYTEGFWFANIYVFITPLSVHIFFGYLNHFSWGCSKIKKIALIHLVYTLFACFYNIVVNFNEVTSFIYLTISGNSSGIEAYSTNFASFFGNRNGFGVLILQAMVSLSLLYRKPRISFFVIFSVLMGSLILTLSRASMLGIAVFIFIVFLLSDMFSKIQKIFIAAAVTLMVSFSLSIPLVQNWIAQFIWRSRGSNTLFLSDRDTITLSAIEYLNENGGWLWGTGKGQVGMIGMETVGFPGFHNAYIDAIIANGVIVLFVYLLILFAALANAVRIYKYDRHFSAVFIACTLSFIIYSGFESFQFLVMGNSAWIILLYIYCLPKMYLNYLKRCPQTVMRLSIGGKRLYEYS